MGIRWSRNNTWPNYTTGDYQVGIIAKSWGGSIDRTFANVAQFSILAQANLENWATECDSNYSK